MSEPQQLRYQDIADFRREIAATKVHYCDSCAGECEKISSLETALEGRAIPRLEDAARRFQELANDRRLPEDIRTACGLWAIGINNTVEKINER